MGHKIVPDSDVSELKADWLEETEPVDAFIAPPSLGSYAEWLHKSSLF